MMGVQDITEDEQAFIAEVMEEVQNHMQSGGDYEEDFNRLVGIHLADIREMMMTTTPDNIQNGPLLALKVFQSFVRLGVGFGLGVLLERAREEVAEEEGGNDVQ